MQELRLLYDRVETEIRNLDSLGLPATNYGPLLVPVLMEKIPSELKLMISKKYIIIRNFGTLKIS